MRRIRDTPLRATCNNSIKLAAESHLEALQNTPHFSHAKWDGSGGWDGKSGMRRMRGSPAELAPVGRSRADRRQKFPRLISCPPTEQPCSNLHLRSYSCNFVGGIRGSLLGFRDAVKELNSTRDSIRFCENNIIPKMELLRIFGDLSDCILKTIIRGNRKLRRFFNRVFLYQLELFPPVIPC